MSDNEMRCPGASTCPIFRGVLADKTFTAAAYKKAFCDAGASGRAQCMRWKSKRAFGRTPDNILPNSAKTLDQIEFELAHP